MLPSAIVRNFSRGTQVGSLRVVLHLPLNSKTPRRQVLLSSLIAVSFACLSIDTTEEEKWSYFLSNMFVIDDFPQQGVRAYAGRTIMHFEFM